MSVIRFLSFRGVCRVSLKSFRFSGSYLRQFSAEVFLKCGVPEEDANQAAETPCAEVKTCPTGVSSTVRGGHRQILKQFFPVVRCSPWVVIEATADIRDIVWLR